MYPRVRQVHSQVVFSMPKSNVATQALEDDVQPEGLRLREASSETIAGPWFPHIPNENNET